MSEKIEVTLDIDGYDVTVDIGVGAIRRRIKNAEEHCVEEVSKNGFANIPTNQFAVVRVHPTNNKWSELSDKL